MRVINAIVSIIIFLCFASVSYIHTIALFEASTYQGWMSIAVATGVELTFAMAALNIVIARVKNEKPANGLIWVAVLGSGMVAWSNVYSGLEAGWFGIILGLVVPLFLVGAETTLTAAIAGGADSQIVNQPVAESSDHLSQPLVDHQLTASRSVKSQPKTTSQPTSDRLEEDSTMQPANNESTNQPTTQPITTDQPLAENQPTTSNHMDRPTSQVNRVDAQPTSSQDSSATEEPIRKTATKPDRPSATTNQRPTKSTTSANQKKRSASRSQATIQPAAKVAKVAEKYREENGKWPSQRGLAELAGVTRHQASKVLSQLKAEESSSQQPAKQANG